MKFLTDDNRKKIVNWLFYAALTIELLLMIVEKSEIPFSLESHVFRVTFLLTLMAVLIMKHDLKEWILIIFLLGLAFFCYRYSGKNDLLRLATFLMAARDIDLRKAMKYSFYVSVVGFALIFLLSVFGIMGDISLVADFGRGENEKRYVFGFGHPNTMFGCAYALLLMWVWLYGSSASWWQYLIVIASSGVVIWLTRSRTGLLICALTLFLSVICRVFKGVCKFRWPYVLGAVFGPIICVVLSIVAAYVASLQYIDHTLDAYFWTVEEKIGYRISNLYYGTEDRGGVLYRWKLFAGPGSDSFFDLGWVRIFYWYGIIPAVIIIACVLFVIFVSRKKKDIWTLILVISLSVYTLMEATFVTVYLGRDFFLLIAGVYLGYFFRTNLFKIDTDDQEGETYVGKA